MFFKSIRDSSARIFIYLATGLFSLLVLYASLGFLFVPYILRVRLPALVANELQGNFRVAEISLNPFSWKLELDGVTLETPDRQPALTVEHIRFDIDILASLGSGNLLADGVADRADIRINLDEKGTSNWGILFASTEETATAVVPFEIQKLSFINSKLGFNDKSNGVALNAVGISADIYDLGPDLGVPARLELSGSSGDHSKLELKAQLTLEPVEVSGIFSIQKFDLKSIAAYLKDAGMLLTQGELNGEFEFDYLVPDGESVFSLKKSKLSVMDIQGLVGPDRLNAKLDKLVVEEMKYDGLKSVLGFSKMHINKLTASVSEYLNILIHGAELDKFSVDFEDFSVNAGSFVFGSAKWDKNENSGRVEAAINNIKINDFRFEKDSVSAAALMVDKAVLQDFSDSEASPQALSFGKISVQGFSGDIGKKLLSVDKFDSADAEVIAWISERGVFEIPGYSGKELSGKQSGQGAQSPWVLDLEEVSLRNYKLDFADRSIDPPVTLGLSDLEIRLTDLDTRQGKFELRLDSTIGKHGKVSAEGEGKIDPPAADFHLNLDGIGLPPFRPYLKGFVRIDLAKGKLNLDGDLAYQAAKNELCFNGMAEIAGLETLDKQEGRDFVNWRSLRAEGLTLETAANRLDIRELIADQPYARVIINRERRLNLIENLFQVESKIDSSQPAKTDEPTLSLTVGALLIRDGSAEFSDLSLRPNVSVDIHSLNGVVRSLSSKRDSKAEVIVKGSISDAAPVTISGLINPFQIGSFADISMRFDNVDLTELSPYSAKFAGYRIEKGKLDLDLHYQLSERKLMANNTMVFDQLTLGERVDSPDATSLPVKLAVSLMQGLDGKIDIDLPISGDLDDPEFSVTGLLATAALGMITNVIGSPFSAMGVLFDGGGGDDAGSIQFASGSSTLDAQEMIKLDEVAKALAERSGLNLEIKGTARSERDSGALAEQQLRRQLENAKAIELRIGSAEQGAASTVVLSNEDERRLFSQFYRLRYPGAIEWAELPEGQRVLSAGLFESARKTMLKDWSIDEIDLSRLAQARAAGIRSYLIQKGISANRIYLRKVELSGEEGDDAGARLSLS